MLLLACFMYAMSGWVRAGSEARSGPEGKGSVEGAVAVLGRQ